MEEGATGLGEVRLGGVGLEWPAGLTVVRPCPGLVPFACGLHFHFAVHSTASKRLKLKEDLLHQLHVEDPLDELLRRLEVDSSRWCVYVSGEGAAWGGLGWGEMGLHVTFGRREERPALSAIDKSSSAP